MSEPMLEEWELIEQLVDSFASRHRAEDSVRWKDSMRQRVSNHPLAEQKAEEAAAAYERVLRSMGRGQDADELKTHVST